MKCNEVRPDYLQKLKYAVIAVFALRSRDGYEIRERLCTTEEDLLDFVLHATSFTVFDLSRSAKVWDGLAQQQVIDRERKKEIQLLKSLKEKYPDE